MVLVQVVLSGGGDDGVIVVVVMGVGVVFLSKMVFLMALGGWRISLFNKMILGEKLIKITFPDIVDTQMTMILN